MRCDRINVLELLIPNDFTEVNFFLDDITSCDLIFFVSEEIPTLDQRHRNTEITIESRVDDGPHSKPPFPKDKRYRNDRLVLRVNPSGDHR